MHFFQVFLLLFAYFFPAVVAFYRKKDNKISILLTNFFLGWTVIGWIVSLVWATTVDKK